MKKVLAALTLLFALALPVGAQTVTTQTITVYTVQPAPQVVYVVRQAPPPALTAFIAPPAATVFYMTGPAAPLRVAREPGFRERWHRARAAALEARRGG